MINIGTKIGERYEIIGNIGSGGMANVYLARDLILNRDVAIKVLRFDFQDDHDAIRRFQREALAATEMVHPNIVSVYDVGEENGMQYIVMEYVKGTDLKQYIKHQSPIALPTVVDIMEQVLSAISLAHQHRIIHRDLKPQNILVDEDGTVKITDFGIAIALSETSITQTNTLLGSVHYLSPEQARGGMATRQSDIYALGIILYELLTGSVPFEGESAVSIALKHFQKDMPSVIDYNPHIPQALENVVLHATAKEIADRYKTVDEMYADIRSTLCPERGNEPRFEPSVMTDDTIMLTPIDVSYDPKESAKPIPVPIEDDEDDDELEPKKSKKGLKIGLTLFVVVIFLGGGLYMLGRGRGEIAIPDVSGKSEEEATQLLEKSKLTVDTKVEEIPDDEIEKGFVIKTNPPIGTSVKEKAVVTLFVSSGSKSVRMKEFVDADVTDAINDLMSQGFKEENIKVEKKFSNSAKENTVMKQTPKVNKDVVPEETKVTLVVSKGAESFTLENMYNYSRNRAMSYLDSVGLTMSEGYEYSDSIPQGQVIYTIPNAGSKVKKGDSISVVFSAGKEPTTVESSTSSTTKTSETETGKEEPATTTSTSEKDGDNASPKQGNQS